MPERTSADARLERLLYILPAASREEGVRLEELARALGTTVAEVLRDLEEATARAYYHPAGSAEEFQIVIEGDRVRVWSPEEFRRPVRFSSHEALALGLGLRTLAAEADEPRRAEILALAARLEAELAAPAAASAAHAVMETGRLREDSPVYGAANVAEPFGAEDQAGGYEIELGDDGFRGAIAECAQVGRRCRILYLKPGDDAPLERTIEPYALVYTRGGWYVIARDVSRDAVRVFRMDRVIEASVTNETFEPPASFDASRYLGPGGMPYRAEGADQAVVRYSARVARWVSEALNREPEPDGSVVVRHDVADPRWVVRHVLQYGGEAELVEPGDLRDRVARAAGRVADRAA